MSYAGLGIIIIGGQPGLRTLASMSRVAALRSGARAFGATAGGSGSAPATATTPCSDPGRYRNPVDLSCSCPPGTHVTSEAGKYNCVPDAFTGRSFYFPNCKDAAGKKVPNCLMGFPVKQTLFVVGVGAVAGAVTAAIVRRLLA